MEESSMKRLIFSLLVFCSVAAWGQADSARIRLTERYRTAWEALVPKHFTAQYAGSIGLMNFGVGWHYYRNHWETELLFGWVPKYASEETKVTTTLKQRYIPWRIPISSRWDIEPLTAGLFMNTIFGENFWRSEPSRYDNGYYGFMTKVRANIFMGQRVRYKIPTKKQRFYESISLYYELSICDLYLVSSVPNSRVSLWDTLSLAFGLKLEIF